MKNNEYWKQRFVKLEEAQNKKSEKYLNTLKEEYNKSLARIEKDITNWYIRLANNNEISYSNAKKLLDKKELQEFKWTVEEYIKKGKENAINQQWIKELENASARVHIDKLNAIKIQIQNELEHLYAKQNKGVEDLIKQQYEESYYKSSYTIQNGLEKYWNIQALDINKIDKIISKPWTTDNQTFSDRIWKNKDELLNTLQKDLTQATIRGNDIDKVIQKIEKDFEVSKGKAGRLVMTESAFFSSVGQKECFNNLDVEKYEIVATLDSRTSEICQELDGKVFAMKDYEVGITAPPFHCNCRSTTVPYFDDEFTQNERRFYRDENGNTGYVNANMNYKEWEKEYKSKLILEQGKQSGKKEKMYLQEQNEIFESKTIKPKLYSNKVTSYRINKYQNTIMKLYHKNKNENMCILDLKTGQLIGDITEGKSRTTVGLNTKTMIKMLTKSKNSIIAIHNHPENYSFSLTDIISFNKIKQIKTMILLTDDYKFYLQSNNTNKYTTEYLTKIYRNIEKEMKKIYNYLNAVERRDLTNQEFFKKVGWIYEKEKN